jgi:AhpD family alkylhydroperoxidase
MSIAISLNLHCEEMIVFHTNKAMQAGASPAEVYETAILAATFGGNGVVSHIATLLRESVRDFEKDFKK